MCIKNINNQITIGDLLSALNSDGKEKLLAYALIDANFEEESCLKLAFNHELLTDYIKEFQSGNKSRLRAVDYELVIALFEEDSGKNLIRIGKSYDFNEKLRSGKTLGESLYPIHDCPARAKLYISREDINDYIFDDDDLKLMSSWDNRIKNAVNSLKSNNIEIRNNSSENF